MRMYFDKLATVDQFKELKKGDMVIVLWKKGDLNAYKIHGIINDNKELLLSKKRNHYFIIDMYLNGESFAKEAWLVTKQVSDDKK